MSIFQDISSAAGADLGVEVRPFPFPFRAALAICSDIDECDRQTFLEVHRYLNDPRDGLGLPVADSFFGLAKKPEQMAYFLPDGRTPGPDAPLIIQAIRAGLIDSLHSWGDFNGLPPEPAALRAVALRLTEDLKRQGSGIKIWINHGDPYNRQNLKARLQPGYRGDDPGSPYYTADLLGNLGVKYYWWSELVSWPLSGHRRCASLGRWIRPGLNAGKNVVKLMMGHPKRMRSSAQITELCHPVTLTDSSPIMAFTRHLRGLKEPTTRHTLNYTLGRPVIEDLVAEEGSLILYTHLGIPLQGHGELFSAPDREALYHLAQQYHEGIIWVAPTIRVLTYWLAAKYLLFKVGQEGEKLIIDLGTLLDPTTGPRVPELKELAGLCFYVPRPQETIFRFEDREILCRAFGRDHTGQWVVGLDPHPIPSIDFLKDF